MQLKHWGVRLVLGAVMFAGVLGCQITDRLVAQLQPTPTSTRTPRPTFTPVPSPTFTLIPPSPTVPPPTATRTATARPAPTRTPTRPPVVIPTPVPQPTTPQFRYMSANKGCEHSGQTFIQGTIYDKAGNRINGVKIAMSGGGPDGEVAATRESGQDGDGFFSIIVNAYGASPGQKRWVWVVEGGRRVSDVVVFEFNNLGPDTPGVCWRGFVDFVLQY